MVLLKVLVHANYQLLLGLLTTSITKTTESLCSVLIKAYEEVYSKLRVIPVSFREDIYKTDKTSLD